MWFKKYQKEAKEIEFLIDNWKQMENLLSSLVVLLFEIMQWIAKFFKLPLCYGKHISLFSTFLYGFTIVDIILV